MKGKRRPHDERELSEKKPITNPSMMSMLLSATRSSAIRPMFMPSTSE